MSRRRKEGTNLKNDTWGRWGSRHGGGLVRNGSENYMFKGNMKGERVREEATNYRIKKCNQETASDHNGSHKKERLSL